MAFAADGSLFSASADGTVRHWVFPAPDAADKSEVVADGQVLQCNQCLPAKNETDEEGVDEASQSSITLGWSDLSVEDDLVLACNLDGTVRVWNRTDFSLVGTYLPPNDSSSSSLNI